jgi:hypothetical protein
VYTRFSFVCFGSLEGVVIATGGATSWATQRFIVHPFKYSYIPDVKILIKCAANLNIVVTNPFVIPSLVNLTHIVMNIDFLLHYMYSRVGMLRLYQSPFLFVKLQF